MMVRWGEGKKVPVDIKHKLEVKTLVTTLVTSFATTTAASLLSLA